MSEYFGALKVDQLNEQDEPHQKLNRKQEVLKYSIELFEECFGFKIQNTIGMS